MADELDDAADWLFDPRSELTGLQQAIRGGQMMLEALAATPSAYDAADAITKMSPRELHGLALMATVHQKRAIGTSDAELSAWARRGPTKPS
jgi:hypothetical protein